jgi:hypothetical protein
MKARYVMAALPLLLSIGCAPKPSEELTQQQKDQIKGELKTASDSIIARWARRDGGGAMEYYSPDVVVVFDSAKMDYKTYRAGWSAYDSAAAEIKVAPTREDYIVLTKDLAVSTWVGSVAIVMKSGDTVTTNPQVYSQVMKKVGDRWLVLFSHPSGVNVIHKAGRTHKP